LSRGLAAAVGFDMNTFDEDGEAPSLASAYVRGRDGRLRAVDVARLAWPDGAATAGVDCMADLSRRGPLGRC